jgi:hypothetical protein
MGGGSRPDLDDDDRVARAQLLENDDGDADDHDLVVRRRGHPPRMSTVCPTVAMM